MRNIEPTPGTRVLGALYFKGSTARRPPGRVPHVPEHPRGAEGVVKELRTTCAPDEPAVGLRHGRPFVTSGRLLLGLPAASTRTTPWAPRAMGRRFGQTSRTPAGCDRRLRTGNRGCSGARCPRYARGGVGAPDGPRGALRCLSEHCCGGTIEPCRSSRPDGRARWSCARAQVGPVPEAAAERHDSMRVTSSARRRPTVGCRGHQLAPPVFPGCASLTAPADRVLGRCARCGRPLTQRRQPRSPNPRAPSGGHRERACQANLFRARPQVFLDNAVTNSPSASQRSACNGVR
ncbi:hypothetical protein SAMN06265879_3065 [Clavibacter michiganensis]|nr:hypothetical protein SAMN06265879_3065 [Clavibacter michiganensis]